jgi:transcriptional regulator GlxA family with amidase domain
MAGAPGRARVRPVTRSPQAPGGMTTKMRVFRPSRVPADFNPDVRCPRWVRRVLALVQASTHGPLLLDDLALAVGRNKCFLVREFRRYYHCSPIRLQRALRLAEAAKRLAAGDAAVLVAAELGFADQSHLTKLFGATFLAPPAAFARSRAQGVARNEFA